MPYDNTQTEQITNDSISRESLDRDIIRNSKGIVELQINSSDKVKLGVPLITTEIGLSSFDNVVDTKFTYFPPPVTADPIVAAEAAQAAAEEELFKFMPSDGTFIRKPSGRQDMRNWDIWWMIDGKKQRLVRNSGNTIQDHWWKHVQVLLRERNSSYDSIQIIDDVNFWNKIPNNVSVPTNWPRWSEWTDYHPSETGYEALPPNDPGQSTYWDEMRVKYEGKMVFVPGPLTGANTGEWTTAMPPVSLFVLINGKWRPIIDFNATKPMPQSTGPSTEHHPNNNPDFVTNLSGGQSPTVYKQRRDAVVLFDAIARTNGVPTFSESSKPYVPDSYASPINGSLWWSANSFSIPGKSWIYIDRNSDNQIYTGTDAGTFSIDSWENTRQYRGIGSWFPDPPMAERLEPYIISGVPYKLRGADAAWKTIHGTSYDILSPQDPIVERNSPFWESAYPYTNVGLHVAPLTLEEYQIYLNTGPDKWDKEWLTDYYPPGDEKYYESAPGVPTTTPPPGPPVGA